MKVSKFTADLAPARVKMLAVFGREPRKQAAMAMLGNMSGKIMSEIRETAAVALPILVR
ncbi:MAG: hypothetical protein ACLP8A_11860 [Methylovirgula sp.]